MSQQLYELVHSMSKAEKKHFKMYISSLGTKDKLSELFDIFNKQKEYDENKLNIKIGKFIQEKLISYEKHKLKNTLIDALTELHFNGRKPYSTGDIINKIELGFKLKNPEIIKEWIEKGRQRNEEERQNGLEYMLKIFEGKLNQLITKDELRVSQIKKEAIDICDKMKLDLEYGNLHQSFKIWYSKNISLHNSKEAKETHKALINNPLFSTEEKNLTFYQKKQLYHCQQYNNHFLRDYKNAVAVSKKMIALFETADGIKPENYHSWISEYPNLIISLIKNNDLVEAYDNILSLETKIENYIPKNEPIYHIAKQRCFNLKTKYFIWAQQYQKVLENEQQIFEILNNSTPNEIHYNLVLLNRLIESSFALKAFEKCLEYINYFHQTIKPNKRVNQIYVRIYEFAIYSILKEDIKKDSVLNSLIYFKKTLHVKDSALGSLVNLAHKFKKNKTINLKEIEYLKTKLNPESHIRLQPLFDWLQSVTQFQKMNR